MRPEPRLAGAGMGSFACTDTEETRRIRPSFARPAIHERDDEEVGEVGDERELCERDLNGKVVDDAAADPELADVRDAGGEQHGEAEARPGAGVREHGPDQDEADGSDHVGKRARQSVREAALTGGLVGGLAGGALRGREFSGYHAALVQALEHRAKVLKRSDTSPFVQALLAVLLVIAAFLVGFFRWGIFAAFSPSLTPC